MQVRLDAMMKARKCRKMGYRCVRVRATPAGGGAYLYPIVQDKALRASFGRGGSVLTPPVAGCFVLECGADFGQGQVVAFEIRKVQKIPNAVRL